LLSRRRQRVAAQAPHSGDWLLALPVANCGLRLDGEAVRVAVGMRLGLSLCVSQAQGLHAMVCKKVPGKIARHHVLMTSFGEPSVLPGSQLSKSPLDWTADKDGKRRQANFNPKAGTVAVRLFRALQSSAYYSCYLR